MTTDDMHPTPKPAVQRPITPRQSHARVLLHPLAQEVMESRTGGFSDHK